MSKVIISNGSIQWDSTNSAQALSFRLIDVTYILFITQILATILQLGSAISVFAWALVKQPAVLEVNLIVDFLQWNTLVVPNTFTSTILTVSSYKVIVLLIIAVFISGLFSLVKAVSLRGVPRGSKALKNDFKNMSTKTTFYTANAAKGIFILGWIEVFTGGFVMFWGISSLAQITNIFTIITLVILQVTSAFAYWLFEETIYWSTKYFYAGITTIRRDRLGRILTKYFDNFPVILPWLLGVTTQLASWVILMLHLGYGYRANSASFAIYRVVVIPLYLVFGHLIPYGIALLIRYGTIQSYLNDFIRLNEDDTDYDPEATSIKQEALSVSLKTAVSVQNLTYEVVVTISQVIANLVLLWVVWGSIVATL